jgi:hypothetical protein
VLQAINEFLILIKPKQLSLVTFVQLLMVPFHVFRSDNKSADLSDAQNIHSSFLRAIK